MDHGSEASPKIEFHPGVTRGDAKIKSWHDEYFCIRLLFHHARACSNGFGRPMEAFVHTAGLSPDQPLKAQSRRGPVKQQGAFQQAAGGFGIA
jgi:hypothetical protein